ncbi:MAG: hypothetical protein QGG25_12390, partial [Phycisphaerae bacterium]|nr:hypothetical protein [Phycisphaerae bacterium]
MESQNSTVSQRLSRRRTVRILLLAGIALVFIASVRCFIVSSSLAATPDDLARAKRLKTAIKKLEPIHETIRKTKRGD